MAKPKGKSKPAVSSRARMHETLREASLASTMSTDRQRFEDKVESDLGSQQPSYPVHVEMQPGVVVYLDYKKELLEREKVLEPKIVALPEGVRNLFLETKLGEKTTAEERERLVREESFQDISNAIELGIRSWAPTLFLERE